jgi:hypothetical protein
MTDRYSLQVASISLWGQLLILGFEMIWAIGKAFWECFLGWQGDRLRFVGLNQ